MSCSNIRHWIIEGTDNLGKGLLIEGLLQNYGYHTYIHYEKPRLLQAYGYSEKQSESTKRDALADYQRDSFVQGFKLLETGIPTIYDRFHLGECVYSDLYRGYSGDYVFTEIEDKYCIQWPENPESKRMTPAIADSTRMILLITSDFSFIQDDGLSIDVTKREEEQELFIKAFNRSMIPNKVMIDVSKIGGGSFKSPIDILIEATGDSGVSRTWR